MLFDRPETICCGDSCERPGCEDRLQQQEHQQKCQEGDAKDGLEVYPKKTVIQTLVGLTNTDSCDRGKYSLISIA